MDSFKILRNDNNILNLTEGNIAVIPCELPNGNPRPIPMFTVDNNPLDIESKSSMMKKRQKDSLVMIDKKNFFPIVLDRYQILPSGNLHIIDIKESDQGKYQCSAKNPLTGQIVNNSQATILKVLSKPLNKNNYRPLITVYKPPVASR